MKNLVKKKGNIPAGIWFVGTVGLDYIIFSCKLQNCFKI